MTAHVPTESNAAQATRKLVREISIFLIGIGLFYSVLGAVCIALIPPEAAPIQGIPRGLFFGVPLFVFAAIHLVCGILLWTTGKTVFGAIGAVASALVCVMAFILTGFSLINCLFAAAPILIGQRLALIAKNRADDAAVLPYR
jgi:hypothetical protein